MRECLKPITTKMIKELRKISKKSLDEETYLLDFTVFSHGYPGYENFDFEFPIRWDAMDEEVGQLDDGDDLLESAGVLIPKELYWSPRYQEFDQNDAAFRVLVQWFADCWEQAGGHKCRYPAYISHHDSGVSFDLKERRWIPNNKKWPKGA